MPDEFPRQSLGDYLRGWPLRVAILALVLAGIGVAFYQAGSRGKPAERDRVTHPGGYSIVPPRDWVVKVIIRTGDPTERDLLLAEPKNWQNMSPSMWVKRLTTAPDEAAMRQRGYTDGTFQGEPALLQLERKKRASTRRALFRRGEVWFEVGVELPGVEVTRLDEWWRFVETFRARRTAAEQPLKPARRLRRQAGKPA